MKLKLLNRKKEEFKPEVKEDKDAPLYNCKVLRMFEKASDGKEVHKDSWGVEYLFESNKYRFQEKGIIYVDRYDDIGWKTDEYSPELVQKMVQKELTKKAGSIFNKLKREREVEQMKKDIMQIVITPDAQALESL